MENIKISVIIPIFNMEKYLQECLDTVLSQTLKEIEIICINDGSKDRSEEIIKCTAQKDERVVLSVILNVAPPIVNVPSLI